MKLQNHGVIDKLKSIEHDSKSFEFLWFETPASERDCTYTSLHKLLKCMWKETTTLKLLTYTQSAAEISETETETTKY